MRIQNTHNFQVASADLKQPQAQQIPPLPRDAASWPQAVEFMMPPPPSSMQQMHPATPLPQVFELGNEMMRLESIALPNLHFSPMQCHRDLINKTRIDQIADRIRRMVQLPPLRGWRAPDGSVVLTDGFYRWLAMRKLKVSHASVLVWNGTWIEAFTQALLANIPHNGSSRKGRDAERALMILAQALGRSVSVEEATAFGLEWTPNSEPSPDLRRLIRLPLELELELARTVDVRKTSGIAATNNPPRRSARAGKEPQASR